MNSAVAMTYGLVMAEKTPDQEIAEWIEALRRFIEGK